MEKLTPYEAMTRLQHRHISCAVPVQISKGPRKGKWLLYLNITRRYRVLVVHPRTRQALLFKCRRHALMVWIQMRRQAWLQPLQEETPPFVWESSAPKMVRSRFVCPLRHEDLFKDEVWNAFKQSRPAWLETVAAGGSSGG